MATTYAYLVDPNKQYMTKSGTINVNGTLRVYDAATDDIVITYKDFNGTENEASIKLDNNGRAIVIADSARAYRLEVYDRYGSLQWTVSPLWCLAAGGGVNISRTEIISTDGSIDIDKVTVGSTTTFDIGLAPNDSDEFLEWITCSEEDCGSAWYPVYQSGTMETEAGQGVKVHGGHLYHFTNSFTVDPNGSGTNYDTFRVTMYCGDEIVDVRDFDIDSSLNDAVLCEFSRDVVPTEDTHVYFKLTIPSTCEVSAEVQCHRIYSGINAVPDTCATKQWVQETFDYNMAEKISYSALELYRPLLPAMPSLQSAPSAAGLATSALSVPRLTGLVPVYSSLLATIRQLATTPTILQCPARWISLHSNSAVMKFTRLLTKSWTRVRQASSSLLASMSTRAHTALSALKLQTTFLASARQCLALPGSTSSRVLPACSSLAATMPLLPICPPMCRSLE